MGDYRQLSYNQEHGTLDEICPSADRWWYISVYASRSIDTPRVWRRLVCGGGASLPWSRFMTSHVIGLAAAIARAKCVSTL